MAGCIFAGRFDCMLPAWSSPSEHWGSCWIEQLHSSTISTARIARYPLTAHGSAPLSNYCRGPVQPLVVIVCEAQMTLLPQITKPCKEPSVMVVSPLASSFLVHSSCTSHIDKTCRSFLRALASRVWKAYRSRQHAMFSMRS